MTELMFKAVVEWQNRTFPKATALSKVNHLIQEVNELKNDLTEGNIEKRLEYADCFLLLFGSAASDGMTFKDICDAICEKMEINYNRKWGKPNEDGVVNHVK
jgi:hypothetical protein